MHWLLLQAMFVLLHGLTDTLNPRKVLDLRHFDTSTKVSEHFITETFQQQNFSTVTGFRVVPL